MKEIDCNKSIGKCPRSQKCSVPLCPLDPDVEERVYLEGDLTCKLDFERLMAITGDGFGEQYRRFTRVSLEKGARFKPLKQTTVQGKSTQETKSQK